MAEGSDSGDDGGFGFVGGEVGAVGMVEHEGADAGFGFHHHTFSELDADVLGPE